MQNICKFGLGCTTAYSISKELLGGKGANLAEVAQKGIPVPYGFTIPTTICKEFLAKKTLDDSILQNIKEGICFLEDKNNKSFGGHNQKNPLLISVRSGAPVSMPGMMDTILNVGLNDETVEKIGEAFQDMCFAYDSYRRLIQMFSETVLEIKGSLFLNALEEIKNKYGVTEDRKLPLDGFKEVITQYKNIVLKHSSMEFPQNVEQQLYMSIETVFNSWNSERAVKYREIHNIPHDIYTAVNIQTMVFGNLNNHSATGVLFTRNPNNGEKELYGEYLVNAQGEDVVAGTHSPLPISGNSPKSLEKQFPQLYKELAELSKTLESNYGDMQDIEFTVENSKLWLLQTRAGKRTAVATLKIAYDLFKEGVLSFNELADKITPEVIEQSLHITIDDSQKLDSIGKGLAASPGVATGAVVFDSKEAERLSEMNKVILVRPETSPEDIGGMNSSQGILTACGGMTSHAAVVARGMGKPCITAANISIDAEAQQLSIGETTIASGEVISIDGASGKIYLGEIPTIIPELGNFFNELMQEFASHRKVTVLANADTVSDIKTALNLGAEGVGLCRTEHMFFEEKRINFLRQMIFALNDEQRSKAIKQLLNFQTEDFTRIFKELLGMPITIRLLDPPLHEFIPNKSSEIEKLALSLGVSGDSLNKKISSMHEVNPMLGHRGCRLGITFPEVYKMQVNAIITSALLVKKELGQYPEIKIMIPLISDVKEIETLKNLVTDEANKVMALHADEVYYSIGTMIELPRAAVQAAEIAKHVDFFAFGTNDLTQTTYGISRDDAIKFVGKYLDNNIFEYDPFVNIDEKGVGKLIEMAMDLGKTTNPQLQCGICGEHGGDPQSIKYFKSIGVDYVSCSPFRIPIANVMGCEKITDIKKQQTAA